MQTKYTCVIGSCVPTLQAHLSCYGTTACEITGQIEEDDSCVDCQGKTESLLHTTFAPFLLRSSEMESAGECWHVEQENSG